MISEHADPLARLGAKEVGGQNVYVYNLAKELGQIGWEVDIFTRWDTTSKQRVVRLGKGVRVIRVKAGPRRYIPRDHLTRYLREFTDDIVGFKNENKLNYDLIHTHYWMSGWVGLKLAKLWEVPIVVTYHSLGYLRYHALKSYKQHAPDSKFFTLRITWERQLAAQADSVLATSPYEKADLLKYYNAPEGTITVIPVGVNFDAFKPLLQSTARRHLKISARDKVILYVGRMEWRKGVGTLIVAFADFLKTRDDPERYRLILVGRTIGPERPEVNRLKKIAHEQGVSQHVTFVGSKEKRAVHYYYAAANLVVVPSYYEPFGIVPLEALSTGTPVVASKVGGLQYTSKDEVTGRLVTPRSPRHLAQALAEVTDKEDGYRQKIKRHAKLVLRRQFSWEAIARVADRHYKAVIKNKKADQRIK